MTSKKSKNPPEWSSSKDHDQYMKELKAWTKVTSVPKKDWGWTIALSMPENDQDIRRKIFNLDLESPVGNEEKGYKAITDYLNENFKRDDVSDLFHKFRTFMKLTKSKDKSMKEYITDFEQYYKEATLAGFPEMPDTFLSCQLMESAQISDSEFMLVLAGIEKNDANIFKKIKNNLLKFFDSSRSIGKSIKTESHIEHCSDTHFGRGGGIRFPGPRFPYTPRPRFQGHQPWRNPMTRQGQMIRPPADKNLNSLGRDGKRMTCNSCGSYRHLVADCWHKAENTETFHAEGAAAAPPGFSQMANHDPENISDWDAYLAYQQSSGIQEPDGEDPENVHNTLYNGMELFDIYHTEQKSIRDIHHTEKTKNSIILDTGCVKNVSGTQAFDDLVSTLSPDTRKQIRCFPSDSHFRFGGDNVKKSLGFYHIPCSINGKNIFLSTDLVDADIPFLMSRETGERMKIDLSMEKREATFFGNTVKLDVTDSGHYSCPIGDIIPDKNLEHKIYITNTDPKYQQIEVEKIHKAFGHPARPQFERLFKDAKYECENLNAILNKLYENCLTCKKFHKTKLKPVVSMPMSREFNETVAIDLKVWPKFDAIILYCVDTFTRFTTSVMIPDKKADTIIKALMDNWFMSAFGPPERILVDNGGEFYNNKFKDVCQNLNITILATAAESPFQNGICERNHAVTDNIVEKMLEDNPRMKFKDALASATFAKNALINVHGYSPFQLVFGRSPNIPALSTNKPPAQECLSSVREYSDRMNAIYSARKTFMQMENSLRINRALKAKMIPKLEDYDRGDKVYYRRGRDHEWNGPATVIGVDNKTILIKHGSFTYSTSQSRLIKISSLHKIPEPAVDSSSPDTANPPATSAVDNTKAKIPTPQALDSDDDTDDEEDNDEQEENPPQQQEHQHDEPLAVHDPAPAPPPPPPPLPSPQQSAPTPVITPTPSHQGKSKQKKKKPVYPTKNTNIFFKVKDGKSYSKVNDKLPDEYLKGWHKVMILAKVAENSKGCGILYNFVDVEKNFYHWIHLNQTEWYFANDLPLPRENPDSIHNYLVSDEPTPSQISLGWIPEIPNWDTHLTFVPKTQWSSEPVQDAMQRELQNFANFDVFDLVEHTNQQYVTSGWVITQKIKNDVKIIKARLCVHGNQEANPVRADSPTVKKISRRIQIFLAVQNNWDLQVGDVTAAYLQARPLDRDVFVKPVAEAGHAGFLWKLKKPCYGLDDSGRKWYLTLVEFLEERRMVRLDTDQAYFYLIVNDQLHGIVTLHVDDLQMCGSELFQLAVVEPLKAKFKFGTFETRNFRYLGWKITQSEHGVLIDQTEFVQKKITKLNIVTDKRDKETPLNTEEKTLFREYVGKLRWLADNTRADIAYDELEASMLTNTATVGDVRLINKMANQIKSNEVVLNFVKLKGDVLYITVFVDASKGILPDGESSAMGYVIFLTNGRKEGGKSPCVPISWCSSKIRRVVNSTFEAETLALSDALDQALIIRHQLIRSTNLPTDLVRIECYTDCDDTVQAIHSTKQRAHIGRCAIDIARIKQMIDREEVEKVKWIDTRLQLADCLTKRGPSPAALIAAMQNAEF